MKLGDDQQPLASAILIGGERPTYEQIENLASALALDVSDLLLGDLLDNLGTHGVLMRNVVRLLDGRGDVSQKDLAQQLGVSHETITRWRTLKRVPDKSARVALVRYFGLNGVEDLERKPFFLSFAPVTHAERVVWLHDNVKTMPPHVLCALFPALVRLLSPSTP